MVREAGLEPADLGVPDAALYQAELHPEIGLRGRI
jgi:hypothetical protein